MAHCRFHVSAFFLCVCGAPNGAPTGAVLSWAWPTARRWLPYIPHHPQYRPSSTPLMLQVSEYYIQAPTLHGLAVWCIYSTPACFLVFAYPRFFFFLRADATSTAHEAPHFAFTSCLWRPANTAYPPTSVLNTTLHWFIVSIDILYEKTCYILILFFF